MTRGWRTQGVCLTMSDADSKFFPALVCDDSAYSQARDACASCAVRSVCLEEQMRWESNFGATRRHGMFGGMTPDERFRLHRRRSRECKEAEES